MPDSEQDALDYSTATRSFGLMMVGLICSAVTALLFIGLSEVSDGPHGSGIPLFLIAVLFTIASIVSVGISITIGVSVVRGKKYVLLWIVPVPILIACVALLLLQ